MSRAAVTRVPTLGLTAAAAAMAGGAAFGAEWTFSPSASFTSEAQSNPNLQLESDKTESSVAGRAAFHLARRTETLDFSADTSLGAQRYQRDTGLDRDDQHLDLAFRWQGSEHVTWGGTAAGARDTTATSELGVTGRTQFNEPHESYNFVLGPSWQASERVSLASELAWEVNRYPDRESDLSDYRYGSANASATYAMTEHASVSLVGTAGRYMTNDPLNDSDNANVRLQASCLLSTLWSISGGAGPSWLRANDRSTRGIVYDFSLVRQLELSSVALSVSRSQSPSGLGIMTDMDVVSLNYSRQLGERLRGSMSVSSVRRKDALSALGIDLLEVRYRSIDATLAWSVAPSWELVVGAGNRVQRAAGFPEGRVAQNYEGRLTLSWTGNPHVY